MTIYEYILQLHHAIPMSREKPCTKASNSEIKRWIQDGSVRINDDRWEPGEEAPPMVWRLVFFPKALSRTTLV